MNVTRLLRAWPVPEPTRVRRLGGTNNLSWRVHTPTGAYIFRVYQNTADVRRIQYEHALLTQLGEANLSFSVPTPITTRSGETRVSVAVGERGDAVAVLFPCIPGRHGRKGDVADAGIAGAALGELDDSLSRLTLDVLDPGMSLYGELHSVHPLVSDPLQILEWFSLEEEQRVAYGQMIVKIQEVLPALYRELPRQIIHSDFGRTNLLIDEGRVTGVLDFEFAAPDLRAMDLTVALYQIGTKRSASRFDMRWNVVEALCKGYAQWVRLDRDEVSALPALLRVLLVAHVVHRAGRWRQGLATENDVRERLEAALRLHAWLSLHGEELVERVYALV